MNNVIDFQKFKDKKLNKANNPPAYTEHSDETLKRLQRIREKIQTINALMVQLHETNNPKR